MPIPRASAVTDWLLDVTRATAQTARRALAKAGAGTVVSKGAYGMDTVSADAKAERTILKALPDAPIPLHLFSEEIGHVRTKGARHTLVADPIDGTRNAVRGLPFWCVSLAVGQRSLSDVEIGVIRDGVTDAVFQATKGRGATLDGEPIHCRPLDPKNVIVSSALDYERELNISWRPHAHFRDLGSSALEMCHIARGGIDLFLSTKQYLRVVDIAASTLIVREAGGHVVDLRRKPLDAGYDLKERVSLYAYGDPAVWQVLG